MTFYYKEELFLFLIYLIIDSWVIILFSKKYITIILRSLFCPSGGPLQVASCVLLTSPHCLNTSLLSSITRYLRVILFFPHIGSRYQPILQRALVSVREQYLVTKTWALGVLIAAGVTLFLSLLSVQSQRRQKIYVYVHTKTHTLTHTMSSL